MLVRTAIRRNRDCTAVRQLKLVHNERDAAAQAARCGYRANCGREDQVGKAAIERLAGPLCGLAGSRQGGGAARAGPVSFEVGSFRHLYRDCAIAVRDRAGS